MTTNGKPLPNETPQAYVERLQLAHDVQDDLLRELARDAVRHRWRL